jgi:hypothetical protein
MNQYLTRLRNSEKRDTPKTDKTDKTPPVPLLSVLSVRRVALFLKLATLFGSLSRASTPSRAVPFLQLTRGSASPSMPVVRLAFSIPGGALRARTPTLSCSSGGKQAAVLGWTSADLFNLDHATPLCRYDLMGLIWSLNGNVVIAMTAHSAAIRMPTRAVLKFYRRNVDHPWARHVTPISATKKIS